jgi:hypothetical protein
MIASSSRASFGGNAMRLLIARRGSNRGDRIVVHDLIVNVQGDELIEPDTAHPE